MQVNNLRPQDLRVGMKFYVEGAEDWEIITGINGNFYSTRNDHLHEDSWTMEELQNYGSIWLVDNYKNISFKSLYDKLNS